VTPNEDEYHKSVPLKILSYSIIIHS